jgi:hypothetical protein
MEQESAQGELSPGIVPFLVVVVPEADLAMSDNRFEQGWWHLHLSCPPPRRAPVGLA